MKTWLLVLGLALVGCATAPVAPSSSSSAEATKAFDHKPQPGETAVCPVSNERFVVKADTKIAEYHGKYYAFCCDDCPKEFEANPSKFAP